MVRSSRVLLGCLLVMSAGRPGLMAIVEQVSGVEKNEIDIMITNQSSRQIELAFAVF
jgi:hypothetical protein